MGDMTAEGFLKITGRVDQFKQIKENIFSCAIELNCFQTDIEHVVLCNRCASQ
jgi:hypothetical protein